MSSRMTVAKDIREMGCVHSRYYIKSSLQTITSPGRESGAVARNGFKLN